MFPTSRFGHFTAAPAWLKNNGTTAKAWLAATSDAIDWSIAHPKEAAAIFTKAYPASGSVNYNIIGWTYTAGLMKGPDGYFRQHDTQWVELAGALKDINQIPSVKAPGTYYTNDYLPQ